MCHFIRTSADRFLNRALTVNPENLKALLERLDQLHKLTAAYSVPKLLLRSQVDIVHNINEPKLVMLEPGAQSAWCSTIPYQRNHGFFGRENQLREIDHGFLNQSSSPNIKTVAIWGTGGIGKSQIALEYAHQRWNSGTSVVLWICSETEGEVAKSIREAAKTLQLDGYSEKNTPDVNRHLLLKWLQTTSK